MANAFSNEEKQALANSVGMSGNVNPDVFNKELVNGEWQMYIKGGAGEKIFGPKPSAKPASVVENASEFAQKAAGKTIEDVYSSMMVRPPSESDLRMQIGAERGYLDRISGIREQAMDVRRKMLSPQSGIFNDPNATPEDKVNAYTTAMGGYMDRLAQLKTMEDEYSSELDTATKIAGERIKQENERNREILNWMKDERSQKNQEKEFALREKQMAQSASQYIGKSFLTSQN